MKEPLTPYPLPVQRGEGVRILRLSVRRRFRGNRGVDCRHLQNGRRLNRVCECFVLRTGLCQMVGTGVTQKNLALKKEKIMEQEIDWAKEIYGRGYARVEREWFRRKRVDFWSGLNGTGPDGTVMMEWERRFGASVDLIKPFLTLTGRAEEYIPCPGSSRCSCAHYVSETRRGELTATCQCDEDDWDCETYQVEPEDVLVHGLDWQLFGDAVRKALQFAAPTGAPYVSRSLREIGAYAAVAAPVYLSLADSEALLRDLIKLQGLRERPFLVLTATGSTWSQEVEAVARPHGGGHISLSSVLVPDGRQFRVVGALQPMLDEFAKRLTRGGNVATMVQRIDDNLNAIAKGSAELRLENQELKGAKQRLEKMLAGGMFAFTQKVDASSFKVLCTILAEGDVAKASRALGVADSTLRDTLAEWRSRGREYSAMLELIRWRKKVARCESIQLNDSVLLEKAASAEHPELLSEVLEGLMSMTQDNWRGLSDELAEALREAIGRPR